MCTSIVYFYSLINSIPWYGCTMASLTVQPAIEGHLGCSQLGAIINK